MKSFKGKQILVTGANGFIGRHLCRRLATEGAIIHGVTRSTEGERATNLAWWFGDLAESRFAREVVHNVQPDIIFHLASHVAGHRELAAVRPTFNSNLQGAVNILVAAAQTQCERIILAGSQEEPESNESSYAVPSSPYAAAKWATSAYARMCHALYQTPVTIARIHMVYGPGQKDERKLIPYTILSLLDGKAPHLTSGDRPVDWIFIEDLIEGLTTLAESSKLNGQTVDLGAGTLITVREVVEKLAGLINKDVKPLFGSLSERQLEQVRIANAKETYALTGWKTRTTLENGLIATIQWYQGTRQPSP